MASISDCVWCLGSTEEHPELEDLCIEHRAEFEGLTVAEIERRDRESM